MSDVDRLIAALQGPPAPEQPPELPEEPPVEGGGHGVVPWALAAAVLLGVGVLALAPDKPWSTGDAAREAPAATESAPASPVAPSGGGGADGLADVEEAEPFDDAAGVAPEPKKAAARAEAEEAEAPEPEMEPEPVAAPKASSRSSGSSSGAARPVEGGAARPRPGTCIETPTVVSLNVVDGRVVSLNADVGLEALRCLNRAILGTPHPGDGVVEETISP